MDLDFTQVDLPAAVVPSGSWSDRVWTGIGLGLDATVMRAMQIVVERALVPADGDADFLRRSAASLLDPALERNPARFFDFGDAATAPLAVSTRVRRSLEGGAVQECRLRTGYRAYAPNGIEPIDRISNGDPIRLERWVHGHERPRGTVVALHGFAMGWPRFDAIALFASQWFRRGLDVALMTLPHHGARKPPQARFSGEWFASPDVARLSEAVREAIYEIGIATRWLREETGAPVGLLGLSLGGYLTALAAALSDDLDFAIPMVPPACIGDLAWRFYAKTKHHRSGGEAAISRDELRSAFRVHSPLAHPLRLPSERVLIVAGRGDRIVPPEHPSALWQHWDRPAIHWFSGSHLAPFGRRRIVKAIERHLGRLDIL